MKLSIVIPAYNESMNIEKTVQDLQSVLHQEQIPHELVLVNDNSSDHTPKVINQLAEHCSEVVPVHRELPRGFGRAIRSGIHAATGDMLALFMADSSDDPQDLVRYYRLIKDEHYDCVFGSRFMQGSHVEHYPKLKLWVNRLVNTMLQLLFWTRHNDLTNAFKIYRMDVIKDIMPLQACHFNITIELSLAALIRKYRIAQIPISWHGRTWGQSNLKLKEMGRRYLATLLKIWFEKMLILDDLEAEREGKLKS